MANNFGKESWALRKIIDAAIADVTFVDCHRDAGILIRKASESIEVLKNRSIKVNVYGLPLSNTVAHSHIFIDENPIKSRYLDPNISLDDYKYLMTIDGNAIGRFIALSRTINPTNVIHRNRLCNK